MARISATSWSRAQSVQDETSAPTSTLIMPATPPPVDLEEEWFVERTNATPGYEPEPANFVRAWLLQPFRVTLMRDGGTVRHPLRGRELARANGVLVFPDDLLPWARNIAFIILSLVTDEFTGAVGDLHKKNPADFIPPQLREKLRELGFDQFLKPKLRELLKNPKYIPLILIATGEIIPQLDFLKTLVKDRTQNEFYGAFNQLTVLFTAALFLFGFGLRSQSNLPRATRTTYARPLKLRGKPPKLPGLLR